MKIPKKLLEVWRGSKTKEVISEAGIGLVSRNTFQDVDSDAPPVTLIEQYKNAYSNFPIVSSCINNAAGQVAQNFYFTSRGEKALSKFSDKYNWQDFFFSLSRELLKIGTCWVELPRNSSGIIEFKFIDPKTMVTYRSKTGDFIGYAQFLDGRKIALWGTTGNINTDKTFTKRKSIKEIEMFRYNVQPGEKYGTSQIHSSLPSLGLKDSIESDSSTIVHRYAAPLIHFKLGNETVLPNPKTSQVNQVEEKVVDIYADTEFVTSWLVDAEVLQFQGKGFEVTPITEHTDEQIYLGLQTPKELILGGNADEVTLRNYVRFIKNLQRTIKTQFEDKIIIGQKLGNKENKLMWEHTEEREWEVSTDILRGLVKDGLVTPQKANSLLPPKFAEKLPDIPVMGEGPIGSPGNPQDQSKFQKGSDKVKFGNNPTDPTKKQNTDGKRMDKKFVANPKVK